MRNENIATKTLSDRFAETAKTAAYQGAISLSRIDNPIYRPYAKDRAIEQQHVARDASYLAQVYLTMLLHDLTRTEAEVWLAVY